MSLFEPNPNCRFYWVQARAERRFVSIKLAHSDGFHDPDGTWNDPSMEIVDFRCPGHPEVDWAWIRQHQRELFINIELGDS